MPDMADPRDSTARWPITPDSANDVPARRADEAGVLPMTPWGDGPCDDCGTDRNPRWSAPSVFWNEIMGTDRPSIVCPPCFAERVYAAGYAPVGFTFTPDFHWETAAQRRDRRAWTIL